VGLDIGPEGNIPRKVFTPSVGHLCSPLLAIDREATLENDGAFH
jgi:hypothetical protein